MSDSQASAVLNSVINQSEVYAATQLRQLEGKHDPASDRARQLLEDFNISSRNAAVKLVQANDALLAAQGASAGGRKKRRGGKGKKRSGSRRGGSKGRRSGSKKPRRSSSKKSRRSSSKGRK
jgi:hypothetical protein